MEDDHPTIASLHKATYGMLLFGIPHRGLVVDDIEKMLAGEDRHPRRELLEQIKKKSDLLSAQLDDFKNLIRDRKVVSFYETGQTRQLQFDSERKRWERTGELITFLDKNSALLELPDSIEEKIPLNADHSMMVKFDSRNAQGYSSALETLRQFAQDAPGVVADRFVRAQNRPKPSIMVPFQRDSAFVGRQDILAKIDEMHRRTASSNHSRVALVGLGGVGKSQIAIEYAYKARESTSRLWVFWVHASNADRFRESYQQIAAKVELPGRDDPKMNILRLVHDWLCDERNGRWLMVVDNADDDRVFASASVSASASEDLGAAAQGAGPAQEAVAPLASFLPQAANGWILVTSRDLIAAVNLVGVRQNVVQVEPMSEQDALELLKSKMRVDESSEDAARALVKTLEGIPLAVTHAAAYIAVREPRVTFSTYLELFRESEENQAFLLNRQEARDIRRDTSAKSAVIATWQISFEQIRKMSTDAADLLSLMAMFDRQGVPEHLLHDGSSRLQFEEAVALLTSFFLIRVRAEKQSEEQLGWQLFEMHSLVQLATTEWVKWQGQSDMWQKVSLRVMAVAFPSGRHETWAACQTLLPHATKVLGYSTEKDDKAKLDWAALATNTTWYLMLMGQYAEAERIGRSALAVREMVLGREDPDTLISVSQLGLVLERQGKYSEAEAMHRRGLEGSEKVLGREHPYTLTSVSNLGSVLRRQGKYGEAEAMHRRALEGREKVFGREHPDTLTSVNNLGLVLESQGKYSKAEAMHQRALEGSEKVFGHEHPNTLNSVNNLGLMLERQGKYSEAEAMQRRALEGREKVFGREHPDTLNSVNNLGLVLWRQGQLADAETLEIRALEATKRVLGEDHPDTLTAMANLACTLTSQGRRREALLLMEACVPVQQRILGVSHPESKATTELLNRWRLESMDLEA